jgi:DNA repair protein RadD
VQGSVRGWFAVAEFVLRTYQQEAVDASVQFLKSDRQRNGLLVLPCGTGKSLVIANIALRLNANVLIFQPSKELVEQNLAKFHSYNYRPAVFSASLGRKVIGPLTLATIGSVKNKPHLFDDFDYILIDECSLVNPKQGMYRDFLKALGQRKTLGLDATPYRLSSDLNGSILKFLTRTRPRVFEDVVYYVQNKDMFDEGYLCPLEYQIVKAFDRHAVKANSTGADFDERALQLHFFKTNFSDKIVKVVQRLREVGRRNCLIFTRFVPEAEYVASKIPGLVVVTADTPKDEREAIVREFRAGRIWGAVNVGVLSVGFDYPQLSTVVLARPTKSLRLYYQQVGRCIRPHPDKESAWIVDMVGLTQEFGKIEDLKIVDGGNGKWFIENTERQLTNVYFSNEGASRCHDCGAEVGFWMRHAETGNRAPLQRPSNGQQGNINLVKRDGKTYYIVVKPGEGEFLHHAAVCERRRRTG